MGRFRHGGKRGVLRVRRVNDLLAKAAMAGAAGQREGCPVISHASTDGIEPGLAVAVQHVPFAVDHAGLVAALAQCSGTLMTGIELADIAASEFLDQAGSCADLGRRGANEHDCPPAHRYAVCIP